MDVFHPASYTVDHSLSGVQSHSDLEIAHMRYAISRLRTRVTQSRDCLCNLEIAQIPTLRGTYTLADLLKNTKWHGPNSHILYLVTCVLLIDDFPCDVTRMRKFYYYCTDHALGGSHTFLMYCGLWGKPDYECISASNSACKIAT